MNNYRSSVPFRETIFSANISRVLYSVHVHVTLQLLLCSSCTISSIQNGFNASYQSVVAAAGIKHETVSSGTYFRTGDFVS